jgi:hypothetical protein
MNLEEQEQCTVLWECAKCKALHIDPEVPPYVKLMYDGVQTYTAEPMLYWLSFGEVICHDCATKAGIPPLDER